MGWLRVSGVLFLNCSVHLKCSSTFPSYRDAFRCRILPQFNTVTVHTPCPYADSRIWRENVRSIRFTMTDNRDWTCSGLSIFLNNSSNTSFQELHPTVQWTALFFCANIRPSSAVTMSVPMRGIHGDKWFVGLSGTKIGRSHHNRHLTSSIQVVIVHHFNWK